MMKNGESKTYIQFPGIQHTFSILVLNINDCVLLIYTKSTFY